MTPETPVQVRKKQGPVWPWFTLAAVFILAVCLRAYQVGHVFFWWDETDFFNTGIYGPHPQGLLDYALDVKDTSTNTWGWPAIVWVFCRFLGPTLAVARIPSVLSGAGAVLLTFLLIYRLIPENYPGSRAVPGLIAALLATLSMAQLEHSQRVYAYAGTTLFSAALLLAHFQLLRVLPQTGGFRPLVRAATLYAFIGAAGLCVHPSLGLLLGASVLLLAAAEVRRFFTRPPAERRRLMLLASGMALIFLSSAILNRKDPGLGLRAYLHPYYHPLSPASIPKVLFHAYDLAAYHLNLFYNPSLYWPESLNPVLLPLICLCILGWAMACAGRFGAAFRHFGILAVVACAIPAALSTLRVFPFGGLRQTLFISPFLFAFTALGFYALRISPWTRTLAAAAAVLYLALWGVNLPRFYGDRLMRYRAEDIVQLWRQSGSPRVYAWKADRPLHYVLRNYPEIDVRKPYAQDLPIIAPFLLVSPNHQFEKKSPLEASLKEKGFQFVRLADKPAANEESERYPTCLYFPPNGFSVYEVLAEPSQP